MADSPTTSTPDKDVIVQAKEGLRALGFWDRAINSVNDSNFARTYRAFGVLLAARSQFTGGIGTQKLENLPDLMRAARDLGLVSETVAGTEDYDSLFNAVSGWFSTTGKALPEIKLTAAELEKFRAPDGTIVSDAYQSEILRRTLIAAPANVAAAAEVTRQTTASGAGTVVGADPGQEATLFNSDGTAAGGGAGGGTGGEGGEGFVENPPRKAGESPIGIAGGAEIWKVDGLWFVAYSVPNTEPPVYMTWGVESFDAMERIVGSSHEPEPDRTLSSAEYNGLGALNMGITSEIVNTDEHPFAAFVSNWDRIMKTSPYMRDPEILGLTLGAMIEGRDLSDAELKSTKWWRSRTEAERSWITLAAEDPKEAERQQGDGRLKVENALREAGMNDPPNALVAYLSDKFVTGAWSEAKLSQQILAVTDPLSPTKVDKGVADLISENKLVIDTTQDMVSEVRDTVLKWLGPAYGNWSDDQVENWAGKLRNDPDAKDDLIEMLRGQRLAMFPEYTDERLSYDDIATPWKNMAMQTWGKAIDESDPLFTKIVRANDAGVAQQLLRGEGLKRGIKQVVDTATGDIGAAFGGTVRRAL